MKKDSDEATERRSDEGKGAGHRRRLRLPLRGFVALSLRRFETNP